GTVGDDFQLSVVDGHGWRSGDDSAEVAEGPVIAVADVAECLDQVAVAGVSSEDLERTVVEDYSRVGGLDGYGKYRWRILPSAGAAGVADSVDERPEIVGELHIVKRHHVLVKRHLGVRVPRKGGPEVRRSRTRDRRESGQNWPERAADHRNVEECLLVLFDPAEDLAELVPSVFQIVW